MLHYHISLNFWPNYILRYTKSKHGIVAKSLFQLINFEIGNIFCILFKINHCFLILEKKMTEAVVSGKDTRCLFINNGDDLLTLKKVVSKKTDKDDEKLKLNKSVETNGSELNGNHNKTDSINFDVDNTSSLEPNLEMDSDTDRNITIGSICTQEDRESETIDISNENSNEADTKNGEKDNQVS